jgi:hypothetical protein
MQLDYQIQGRDQVNLESLLPHALRGIAEWKNLHEPSVVNEAGDAPRIRENLLGEAIDCGWLAKVDN